MQVYNLLDEASHYQVPQQPISKNYKSKSASSPILHNNLRLQRVHNERQARKGDHKEKKYQKNKQNQSKQKCEQQYQKQQKLQKIENSLPNNKRKSISLNNNFLEKNVVKNNWRSCFMKSKNSISNKVGFEKQCLNAKKLKLFDKEEKNKYRIEKYNTYTNFSNKKLTTKNLKTSYGEIKEIACKVMKVDPKKPIIKLEKPQKVTFSMEPAQIVFNQMVLATNRIKPLKFYSSADVVYKAYVSMQKNTQLIRKNLTNRKNWILTQQILEANFVWIPSKNRMHFLDKTAKANKQKRQCKHKISIEIQKQELYSGFLPIHFPQKRKLINKLTLQNQCMKVFQESEIFVIDDELFWEIAQSQKKKIRLYNHFEFNENLCHLPTLYHNLKQHYAAKDQLSELRMPLTFQIQDLDSFTWINFKSNHFRVNKGKVKKAWIIKPGRHHKRGVDIFISKCILQISDIVQKLLLKYETVILQQSLQPFLYKQRKMDIKCYLLVTSINDYLRAYWYEEGYIRTCSEPYSAQNLKDKYIHLCNDSIQKKSPKYGDWESENKLMFPQFEYYLRSSKQNRENSFYHNIYPDMQKIMKNVMDVTAKKLNTNRRQLIFQLYEFDFLIDNNFKLWLTQINNNPSFQVNSSAVKKLFSSMLNSMLHIVMDPIFVGQKFINCCQNQFQNNKFNIVFEESLKKQEDQIFRQVP